MPMTMNSLTQQMNELASRIRNAATTLAAAAADDSVTMDELTRQRGEVARMTAQMQALRDAYNTQTQDAVQLLGSPNAAPTPPAEEAPGLRALLGSNEYARAFAYAVRNGITPKRGRGIDKVKPLYDAMTIGGGDPAGEDGGFLVPIDIDNQIIEIRRTLNPLAELFTVEPVSANSGWRVVDAAPTTGMASVDEMGELAPGEQPTFGKVTFTLGKYGMYIPVSNELAQDEVANLFGYLARWFAKKCVITENNLLLGVLDDLTATAIAQGDELKGIKAVLNKVLDPAISLTATLLTNQTGFDVLDNMTDGTGRPLLEADPKTATPMLFKSKPVMMVADAVLPNVSGKAPIYVGDFRQYATLFVRNPLEVVSTDIGGNAFRTDSIEVRGIKRMSVSKFDTAAVALRTVTP